MLRINYVTISGFKSYASKHHIGPFSPRVTLLVGCNGSGKSSLLEAISFVLGSDSVILRSNNLRSLIARAKSEDTPCSVALHCSLIQNSDGECSETGNLDVTRTIDKRGTSKYYLRLNDEVEKPVKFDELQRIMREYGVDMSLSERFIIRQHNTVQLAQKTVIEMLEYLELQMGTKKIRNEIVAKTKDLEESCKDIETFKQQEQQVNKEIERLKPFLEQLTEYNALRDKILAKSNKINFLHLKSIELAEKELLEQLDEYNKSLKGASKKKKAKEKGISELKVQLKTLQAALNKMDIEGQKFKEQLSAQNKRRATLKAKKQKLEAALSRDRLDASKIEQEIGELSGVLSAHNNDDRSDSQDARLRELKSKKIKIVSKCEISAQDVLRQYQDLRTQLFEALTAGDDLKNCRRVKKNIEIELHDVLEKLSRCEQKKEDTSKKLEELEGKRTALRTQKDGLENELRGVSNEVAEKKRAINAMKKTNDTSKEQKLLSDLKTLFVGVLGFVKDQLKILDEDKYYVPIMNILSSVRNHVVVRSRDDARHVIQYYEKNKIGTVTCQILEELKIFPVKEDGSKLLTALKVVDFNEELRPLFSTLLSSWFIVEDKTQALRASFDSTTKTRRNVVTMEGHLFKADGEILPQRIGSNKNERDGSTMLTKLQDQLKTFQLKEESLKHELLSVTNHLGAVKQEVHSISDELKNSTEQQSALKDRREQLEEGLQETSAKLADYEQLRRAEDQFKELSGSTPLIKELFGVEREMKELEDRKDKLLQEQREVIKLKAKIDALKKKHDRLLQDISSHENEDRAVNEEYEEIETAARKIKKQKAVADKEQKLKQTEVDKLNDSMAERKRELNSLVKQSIAIEAEIKQAQVKLNSLNEQKKELQQEVLNVMDTSEDNDFDISSEEYKRRIKRLELKLRDLNRRLKELAENNQLDLEANEKHDKLVQNLDETRKSMEAVQNRARELQLEISKLEDERFKTFCFYIDKINNSLSDIYHKLTINGDCYLGFTEDKKALFESGVWFQVKPDRNQWRSFNDLSGGQKAVAALALSLAINDVFPSAIYLFDEIDASLDIGAVGRVAKWLQRLSQTNASQFIVISHRVPFIQSSNVLVGVYQRHGESQVAVFKSNGMEENEGVTKAS